MMVNLLHRGGTPRSTLQACLVPAYIRKNASVSRGGSEGTCAWMRANTPDAQICLRFSSWNVGTPSEKSGEIAETLKRCGIDICFLQEVRWRGKGDKMIGNRYNLLWSGLRKRENGVGAMVANRLVKKILEVEWTVTGL